MRFAAGQPYAARQAQGHAPFADKAPLAVGIGKPRSGLGHDKIRRQRQFQPASEAHTVHRRDYRLRQRRQPVDNARLPTLVHRRCADCPKVCPGAKSAPLAAQHDAADGIRLPFKITQMRFKCLKT